MARRHQQTRVEHDGTEYRVTVTSDGVTVEGVKQRQFAHGGSNDLLYETTDEERTAVLLDNAKLSFAKTYRRAYSHAKRRERYT